MAECRLPQTPRPTPHPQSPHEPEICPGTRPTVYGRYGALRDEVLEEDMEWDMEGPEGDPMECHRCFARHHM